MQATFSRAVVERSDSHSGSTVPKRPTLGRLSGAPHIAPAQRARKAPQACGNLFKRKQVERSQTGQFDLLNSNQRIKQRSGAKSE